MSVTVEYHEMGHRRLVLLPTNFVGTDLRDGESVRLRRGHLTMYASNEHSQLGITWFATDDDGDSPDDVNHLSMGWDTDDVVGRATFNLLVKEMLGYGETPINPKYPEMEYIVLVSLSDFNGALTLTAAGTVAGVR